MMKAVITAMKCLDEFFSRPLGCHVKFYKCLDNHPK